MLDRGMAKILLFEDDPLQQNLYTFFLQHHGHEVLLCDCDDVVGLAAANRIDLVLTDIVMPQRWGWQIIHSLREQAPELPVVAMSGGIRGNPQEYLEMARLQGADHVLAKPFDLDDLLAAIEGLLASRPPATG